MGGVVQSMSGNWAMSQQHKASAAVARANARVTRAQGRVEKSRAEGQAMRMEAENIVAGQQASNAMARLRGQENAVVGQIQAARGASGFTAEGSGMQSTVSAMKAFEQQAQDMAYSRSLQDISARYSAAMTRKGGEFAEWGANIEGTNMDLTANMYSQMAKSANRAGTLSGVMGLAFGEFGGSMAGLYNAGRVGTYENQYGMGAQNMAKAGAGLSALYSWLV